MKRILVIVEGDTEEAFVNVLLQPYFIARNISISCFKIKHSKGGMSKYSHFKKDIIKTVYESNVILTSLIDYYALPSDFPGFEQSKTIVDKASRLTYLENAIKEDIEETQQQTFDHLFPYIQLHEFEALIFSSIVGIQELFEEKAVKVAELKSVFANFSNPELINDGAATAPSKRLLHLINGYNKVVDGNLILDEIGLDTIIEKCPRFRWWLLSLEQKATT